MRYSYILPFLLATFLMQLPALYAQDSTGISYQAIVRTADGKTVTNGTVGVQISILQTSPTGDSVYTERHTLQTNKTGLLTLEIGTGTATSGSFHDIDWSDGPYFVKSEIDPQGGTSYTIIGTFQLLSVPYALHALRTGRSPVAGATDGVKIWRTVGSDTLYFGADSVMVIIPGLDSANPVLWPEGYKFCDAVATSIDTVTSTTGAVWMDRNLGASRVAESSTDSLAYGSWFQWGRFADGHQCRNSNTTTTLASTSTASADQAWAGKFIVINTLPFDWLSTQDNNLWQGVDGVNNPCPTGFRIPTGTEWEAEIEKWAESGNKNSTGAYNSSLKLPVSGVRTSSGGPTYVGSGGYYWSVSGSAASNLSFFSSFAKLDSEGRALGSAVRCIKD